MTITKSWPTVPWLTMREIYSTYGWFLLQYLTALDIGSGIMTDITMNRWRPISLDGLSRSWEWYAARVVEHRYQDEDG
jgi:hypothetical protein